MERGERLKITLVGIILILAGIGILIFNFVLSSLVSLGIIPLTAIMMIVIGFLFLRRAFSRY
ncbi:MAG: hypothetical protein HY361_04410 [Candidatus Aenigmarchaeota archaeon]|nr:hypothetical protein [Candidatus Aenigmarchaeota archaeon]